MTQVQQAARLGGNNRDMSGTLRGTSRAAWMDRDSRYPATRGHEAFETIRDTGAFTRSRDSAGYPGDK